MLSRLLRELLFALLHSIITLCEVFSEAFRVISTWRNKKAHQDNELEYIIHNSNELERKPKHLVIFVEERWLSTKELADLALWSLLAGIPYLSFYDADGLLEPKKNELFLKVEKRKCGIPGVIKWSKRPDINGYSKDQKPFEMSLNIFSECDGKQKMTEFVRDLIQHKVTCSHKEDFYTAEELDPIIKSYYSNIPDPELVTYCGPVCITKGLLPWQIRLSEFIPLDKYKQVSVEDFMCVLRRYSKCDQRFGK